MSITQIKGLTWIASVGLFVYMFLFAWNFELGLPQWAYDAVSFFDPSQTKAELRKGPTKEEQIAALSGVDAPPPEVDDLVEYKSVLAAFVEQDFSGRPPAVVVDTSETEAEQQEAPVTPVAELLRVLFIRFDSGNEMGSNAFVKYIAPELARIAPEDSTLLVGDRLPSPHEHIRVDSIGPGFVVFGFDDEERETEQLATAQAGDGVSYIAKVGEGGEALMPATDVQIPSVTLPSYNPAKSTFVRSGHVQIGYEDQAEISRNWQEILSREVRSSRHRNPTTGRYDGIQIDSIKAGSVGSRHGVENGDVLKSINGQPVTSKSEAIKFVKNNDDVYDRWDVVIERLGREITITYDEPAPQN